MTSISFSQINISTTNKKATEIFFSDFPDLEATQGEEGTIRQPPLVHRL